MKFDYVRFIKCVTAASTPDDHASDIDSGFSYTPPTGSIREELGKPASTVTNVTNGIGSASVPYDADYCPESYPTPQHLGKVAQKSASPAVSSLQNLL